jgi:glycogen debranching enzyme
LGPHSPYYGTADATPLFLVLLDAYERWTGDRGLVAELEPNARAALAWIDRDGDLDGDGYVEYRRRNEQTGLENQCWKDSWNAIRFADGSLAQVPIATCEIQGYVYDAKVRAARLAREIWDDSRLSERLESEARDLRRRFNDDFWLEPGSFFALALDRDKQLVDSLTPNIGQLLWSGIVDEERARPLVAHLFGEALFSGWGVRTLAESARGYDPVGYHIGTVWPHDTSLIALGLARYGFREEAGRLALAMFQAATEFGYRLPEAFAGYPRDFSTIPVEYPTASKPQAWAAGAPLLLLRALLGLEPGRELSADPVLPKEIGSVAVSGIRGRWEDVQGRGLSVFDPRLLRRPRVEPRVDADRTNLSECSPFPRAPATHRAGFLGLAGYPGSDVCDCPALVVLRGAHDGRPPPAGGVALTVGALTLGIGLLRA